MGFTSHLVLSRRLISIGLESRMPAPTGSGRNLLRQAELDAMLKTSRSTMSKRDIGKRQHRMERSFARAKQHGHGRARWRGLSRVSIQEYLICAIQNIAVEY